MNRLQHVLRLRALLPVLLLLQGIQCAGITIEEDKPPKLLDSILLPSEPDSESSPDINIQKDKLNDHPLPGYEVWPVYPQAPAHPRQNQFVSPLGLREFRETSCPEIHCFTFQHENSESVQLGCKSHSDDLTNYKLLDRIKCRYWKNPTTQTGVPGAGLDLSGPSTSDGRGFDLKIILSPDHEQPKVDRVHKEASGGSERRIQIDELSPGLLGWLIQTLRMTLHMQKSPVHLTLSFIYIKKLRRIDLGDLSAQSHVTRLSLWNPFEWDEDSLIPFPTSPTEPNFVPSSTRAQVPPYFRLTVFCDHANRNPSFRRLWLPWKSWQVRFNHCHDLYVCRTWLSKYPMCDKQAQTDSANSPGYMPSSFIMPKLPNLDMTTLSTMFRAPVQAARVRADNQILYENQCQMEPSPMDPLDDLKLDYEKSCWQPGAYQSQRIGDPLEFILPSRDKSVTGADHTGIHLSGNDRTTRSEDVISSTDRANNTTSTTSPSPSPSSGTSTIAVTEETMTSSDQTNAEEMEIQVMAKVPVNESHLQSKMSSKNESDNIIPFNNSEPKENATSDDIISPPPFGFLDLDGVNQFSVTHTTTPIRKQVSMAQLTTAVIVLSVLVIVLLLGVIFLILWVRSRQHENKIKVTQTNGFVPYTDPNVFTGHSRRSQQWGNSVGKRQPTSGINSHNYATMDLNGASRSCLLQSDGNAGSYNTQYNKGALTATNGYEVARSCGLPTKYTGNSSVYNGSRPPIYGSTVPIGTDSVHTGLTVRPPLTPKQKSNERRVRRASHPSESPSLNRKQPSMTKLHKEDNEYRGADTGQRTPGLERSRLWLTSSQNSLHSRSRLRGVDQGSTRSGRRPDSSPVLTGHNVLLSDFARLRPDQSPLVKMKKHKYPSLRQTKKQHTLVFEDGDLDDDKLPVALRSSLRRLCKSPG
ncbi:hypothetical protein FBUS_03699 [Fasciolopsis buskii]|uniref:Uncharacterized protein n=1 Tax=Fasciolopsis buskii TaxID=27845 RepID=A0A8E0RP74_9TREM|nr:hypothetical protein FBUS_03699 [Fasciolopsis buski]